MSHLRGQGTLSLNHPGQVSIFWLAVSPHYENPKLLPITGFGFCYDNCDTHTHSHSDKRARALLSGRSPPRRLLGLCQRRPRGQAGPARAPPPPSWRSLLQYRLLTGQSNSKRDLESKFNQLSCVCTTTSPQGKILCRQSALH